MQVRAYRNLRSKTWTVQHKTEKGWRKLASFWHLELRDVQFKVSEAGRQRVLREKQKNVHAFVYGTLEPQQVWLDTANVDKLTQVSYNPYRGETFYYTETQGTILHTEYATFTQEGRLYVR